YWRSSRSSSPKSGTRREPTPSASNTATTIQRAVFQLVVVGRVGGDPEERMRRAGRGERTGRGPSLAREDGDGCEGQGDAGANGGTVGGCVPAALRGLETASDLSAE